MSNLARQLKKATEHLLLDPKEKMLMRERLVSYMEHKPIRNAMKTRPKAKGISIPIFGFFRTHHISGALLIAFLATTSTFGMSFAADDALPGDLLYPVKVKVNEEVRGVFIRSDTARIEFERKRAELRLTEASQLASEGRLDTEKQEEVARLFAEHAEAVTEKVQQVEENDPIFAAEVSTEFEAALDTHEAILARLIVEGDGEGNEGGRELVEQVRNAANEAEKLREEVEERLAADDSIVPAENTTPAGGDTAFGEESAPGTPKTDSANMRERAAYRAQERAQQHLVRAEELLVKFSEGQDSELAKQARLQIESGKQLMAEGEQALAEHELGAAYRLFRQAAASFQKVAQLLEVADLFSIEILPEPLAVPTSSSSTTDAAVDDPDNAQQAAEEARAGAQQAIRDAQTLLLTQEGYDTKTIEEANRRIKDATAHVLRGEIALVLDEVHDARTLFRAADKEARRASELLAEAAEHDAVQALPQDEHVAPQEPRTTATPTLKVLHNYVEGVHTYSGTVELPTPCHTLTANAVVMESYPEQVQLVLTISPPAADLACTQVADKTLYAVEVTASADAQLTGITLASSNVPYALTEQTEAPQAE